jgi:hypothetical protein
MQMLQVLNSTDEISLAYLNSIKKQSEEEEEYDTRMI